jgi:hypothetical protein
MKQSRDESRSKLKFYLKIMAEILGEILLLTEMSYQHNKASKCWFIMTHIF